MNNNVIDLEKIEKKQSIDTLGLLIQTVLIICLIASTIAALFINELVLLSSIIIFLLLLVMAYNNQKTFKRKYATIIYILAAMISIFSVIIQILF